MGSPAHICNKGVRKENENEITAISDATALMNLLLRSKWLRKYSAQPACGGLSLNFRFQSRSSLREARSCISIYSRK